MPEQNEPPFSRPLTDDERVLSDEAIVWFARLRSGTLSEQEALEFERWKRRSPAHEQAWTEICALWNEPALVAAAQTAAQASAHTKASRKHSGCRWSHAAVLAAILLLGTIGLVQFDLLLPLKADYRTATGERRTIQLSDGSAVTLNTGSAIGTDFGGEFRRTRLLKGEAFFVVEPDSSRPFLVESHGVVTRAIGTKFLVRERRGRVQVTVVEGMVEMTGGAGESAAPLRLIAGQQVSLGAGGPDPVHEVDLNAATAWMHGRLVFDAAPLAHVIEEVSRYHQGYVLLLGTRTRQIKISGTYHLADTDRILTTIAQTLSLQMVRLGDHLVILY